MSIMLRLSSKMSESSSDEEAASEEGARDETGAGPTPSAKRALRRFRSTNPRARAQPRGGFQLARRVFRFVRRSGSSEGSVWAPATGRFGRDGCELQLDVRVPNVGDVRFWADGGRDGGGGVADARVALTTASAIASTSSRSMAFDGEDSGGS